MVFLRGGGNGSPREEENATRHAAAMRKWGKAQNRVMNRARKELAAAHAAEQPLWLLSNMEDQTPGRGCVKSTTPHLQATCTYSCSRLAEHVIVCTG